MADIYQIIENNGTPKSIEDRKARTNIAPYFNVNNANAVGDLVLSDNGVLYRFNAAYTAGTSWNSRTSKEQVNLAEIKAPLDSPAFTGIPTAPTAAAGTSNTQIATTAYTDNAIAPINSSINAIDSSLAIVSNGDTHIALSSGQYVYIKNHSSLTEGLYTANSAIGANVALTSSNVTSTSNQLNKLKSLCLNFTNYTIGGAIDINNAINNLPNSINWLAVTTDNNTTGELVNLSGSHLFYIVQIAVHATMRFQIAISADAGKIFLRVYQWWYGWSSWVKNIY